MKILRRIGLIFLVIATVLYLFTLASSPAPAASYFSPAAKSCLLVAHMGGDRLWPGNTRYAYDQAYQLGVDVFDLDVHLSKDGVLVLMHDETLQRTTNGQGKVEDHTWAELAELDGAYNWSRDRGQTFPYRGKGIKITRLDELFQAYPGMRYLIELKRSRGPIAASLAALIRQHRLERKVIVASFHDQLMAEFRAAAPTVATSASRSEATAFVVLSKVGLTGLLSPRYQSLQVPYEPRESMGLTVVTPAFIRAAHAKNVKVEVWTINDAALMKQYIALGVDGINTDKPDVLKAVLAEL